MHVAFAALFFFAILTLWVPGYWPVSVFQAGIFVLAARAVWVLALEFAMVMTQGQHILALGEDEYSRLRAKVAGCMSLLISHFDIVGARSTLAAQAEKQRIEALAS